MQKQIRLTFGKTTKYTEVYKNDDYNITFYIPKVVLEGKKPPFVYVTISDEASD